MQSRNVRIDGKWVRVPITDPWSTEGDPERDRSFTSATKREVEHDRFGRDQSKEENMAQSLDQLKKALQIAHMQKDSKRIQAAQAELQAFKSQAMAAAAEAAAIEHARRVSASRRSF